MMNLKIAPSLLAADFLHLEKELRRAETSGAVMLHCDVMDGVYVPNISFGFDIIRQIHAVTNLPLDVHMMTVRAGDYIDTLKKAGASSVTLHSDTMEQEELIETLKAIKSLGMNAAVSLRPNCPAADIFPFVPYLDMVLVMTVEPGFGGQKFRADMMPKVREIRKYLDAHNPECDLQVDGGVSAATIAECTRAGANVYVVGTAAFRADDMTAAVGELLKTARSACED
ncbi:MAG: ribulose-phosphate 3-epimerase [Eubacteriales bacterium]